MSLGTWNAQTIKSELRPYSGTVWRLQPSQVDNAFLILTRDIASDLSLDQIVRDHMPSVFGARRHLDPAFCQQRRFDHPSRFRPQGTACGVWYAAEQVETAVFEVLFYQYLRYADAGILPSTPAAFVALSTHIQTNKALYLTESPFNEDRQSWILAEDYSHTLNLASLARAAGVDVIVFESVRDPLARSNVAVFSVDAIDRSVQERRQSWSVVYSTHSVVANREFPPCRLRLPEHKLLSDTRTAHMVTDSQKD